MKNIKYIVQGFLLLALFLGTASAITAYADDNKDSDSGNFLNAKASLNADALIKLESSTGVVAGPDNVIRVISAEVTSTSGSKINASTSFGNSSLNFVVNVDADTKSNGKVLGSTYASTVDLLDDGDKISFSGRITSSSSSSITVDGDHIVSRALPLSNTDNKTSFKGEVKTINTSSDYFTFDLKNGKTVKVNVSDSTVIKVDGVVKTLSALEVGGEVHVVGQLNADGSVITASKVTSESNDNKGDNGNKGKVEKGDKGDKKEEGWFRKILNWFWE